MAVILSTAGAVASIDSRGKYQQYIDGLRAIAVGAVILFHLIPSTFQGGFVGVDVFFVISGFLITAQIRQQIANGTFSIATFYARRIRRITPALITMLLLSAVAAMFILKPEDMYSFAKSLLVQPLALQNFVFLAEGEYFRGADTKPLLHTWSLAIEEQFYVFWPLLLLLVRRMRRGPMLALIALMLVASFVINNQLIVLSPKSSFFLLPTRAWEMGMGGLVALLHEDDDGAWRLPPTGGAALSATGVLLTLFSIVYVDSSMPFPGNVALLPVFGTFLVLLYGGQGQITQSVLTQRAMVGIGLISYPLYLWHWPVLAFMHHLGLSTHETMGVAVFLVLTFGLSILSNRLIENPIRQRRWLGQTRQLCLMVGACFGVLALFALHAMQTKGALYRFDAPAQPFLATSFDSQNDRCGFVFRTRNPKAEICELLAGRSDQRILLWGNSHADMWSAALKDLAARHDATLYLNAKNCRGLDDSAFCGLAPQDSILREITARQVTDVVLASTWHTSYGIPDDVFEVTFTALVNKLAQQGVRVWLVVDVPVAQQFDPIQAYKKDALQPKVGTLAYERYEPQRARELALFERAKSGRPQIRIIDVRDVFCETATCAAGRNGEVWYRDDGHLTNTGARAGVRAFHGIFAK